jgi:ribonuclease III
VSQGLARKRALRGLARKLGLGDAAARSPAVDIALLDVALTHDSHSAERAGRHESAPSNERLEFLGDAVLGALVAEALFRRHPDKPEGKLSRLRAALVSRGALAQTAQRLEIAPLLLLGRGEAAAGGAQRPSILAAAFEAIVGAVYLSSGHEAARRFIERHHLAHAAPSDITDPKTTLQEYVQAKFKKAPHYALSAHSGPAHARVFTVAVDIAGQGMGTGEGATKQQAETAAAREALERLGVRTRDMR